MIGYRDSRFYARAVTALRINLSFAVVAAALDTWPASEQSCFKVLRYAGNVLQIASDYAAMQTAAKREAWRKQGEETLLSWQATTLELISTTQLVGQSVGQLAAAAAGDR